MTLFESLLMAHILGDWILQTEWQALNKETNWRAMTAHVSVYSAVVLVVLGVRFGWTDASVYAAVVALAIVHVILDRRRPLLWFMRVARITVAREPEAWFMIAVDQAVHVLFLGMATVYLSS